MKVVALLSWYLEKPEWLAELVASCGRAGVDHIVCCDGAYALFPEAKGNSGSEQGSLISAAAIGSGMGVTVHQQANLEPWWGNEVEKRTMLFRLAHFIAEPGVDWLWVLDADEIVTSASGLREDLASAPLGTDAAEVTILEGPGQRQLRKLFRAQPDGITVEGYHARYVTGDGRVLWGPQDEMDPFTVECGGTKVRHRPDLRHPYRKQDKDEYYSLRGRMKIES